MNIREMKRIMEILAWETGEGEDASVFAGADHDVIYFTFPEYAKKSKEYKELVKLGLFWDSSIDTWILFA